MGQQRIGYTHHLLGVLCLDLCFSAPGSVCISSNALSLEFSMDWVPKPTFLSTDLPSNLSTSPCPGLSRASARCGLTGTGAHPLAEGRENSGWNRPSLCFLFDESEPSSHTCSTLGPGLLEWAQAAWWRSINGFLKVKIIFYHENFR